MIHLFFRPFRFIWFLLLGILDETISRILDRFGIVYFLEFGRNPWGRESRDEELLLWFGIGRLFIAKGNRDF